MSIQRLADPVAAVSRLLAAPATSPGWWLLVGHGFTREMIRMHALGVGIGGSAFDGTGAGPGSRVQP